MEGTEQSGVPDTLPVQLVLITAASKTEGSSGVRGRVPAVGVLLSRSSTKTLQISDAIVFLPLRTSECCLGLTAVLTEMELEPPGHSATPSLAQLSTESKPKCFVV